MSLSDGNEQESTKEDIDYGTGEGSAYGGSDPDVPLFISDPDDSPSNANDEDEDHQANHEYPGKVLNRIYSVIARIFKWLFSNAVAWSAVASVVMAVATVFYTVYAHRQWKVLSGQLSEMHDAAAQAKIAAQVAKDTLWEMQHGSGSQDTHTLAQQAVTQAAQTTNLVTVTRDLATWSKQSAEVELALNRPVVIAQNPVLQMNPFNSSRPRQIDGYLVLSLQNSGRLTAQDVRYKIADGKYAYSSLVNRPEGLTRYVRNKIDSVLGDSKIEWTKIGDISFGSPSDHIIPLQLYADDDGPIYIWAGRVEYFDQFGEWQWFEFCFQVRTGRVLAKYPTTPITFEPTATTFRCPIGQSSGTRRTENKNK